MHHEELHRKTVHERGVEQANQLPLVSLCKKRRQASRSRFEFEDSRQSSPVDGGRKGKGVGGGGVANAKSSQLPKKKTIVVREEKVRAPDGTMVTQAELTLIEAGSYNPELPQAKANLAVLMRMVESFKNETAPEYVRHRVRTQQQFDLLKFREGEFFRTQARAHQLRREHGKLNKKWTRPRLRCL